MPQLHRTSRRRTFAVLAASAGAFAMLQSLVSPVLPVIQRDLHTSASTVTWVLTAWLLAASVATPLMGRIGDMIGKERTLLVALGAIAAGCLVAALAPNAGVLIAARVIQGLGGAVFPLSFGIIRDEFPADRVVSAVGAMSAVVAVGGGTGIVLAGPVVAALDWRWLFWLPFGVIVVTGLMAYRWIPSSPLRTPGRVNWLAAVLLSGWLVALLLPLSKANRWGWGSPGVVGLLALAAALFAAWVLVEVRSGNPLIDMRMMRLPAVWTTNVVALLFGAAMFGVYAFLPQFLQAPNGFAATVGESGLLMLPMLVTMAVTGALSGPATRWLSSRAQVAWGAVLGAVACALLAAAHAHPWQVALASGVFGVGIGLAYAAMTALIVHSVPVAQTGVASGMNANIRTIGASIGTAVVSAVVTHDLRPDGLPRESGFTVAFTVLAAAATVAVLVALLIPSARRAQPASAPADLPRPAREPEPATP